MTPKERWLAAIHMQPVDRLPFWPKLNGSYPRAQAAPFRDMTLEAIHAWIGSDQHVGVGQCLKEARRHTAVETRQDGDRQTVAFRAGEAETCRELSWDVDSQSWHPIRFPAETRDDIALLTEVYNDVSVELDAEALEQCRTRCREIGETALTTGGIGESPLMHWVEWIAGVENAHYLLADCRDEVEGLFDAMHRVLVDRARLLAEHHPADLLYMVENTSTTLISPAQFRQYCGHHLRQYADIVTGADRHIGLHMCGHLKVLLPDLAELPVRAFEAFTSPTLGDTTLLDGRSQCPDTCLVGGTNAMLWTRGADEIIARIERDLEPLPHHRGLVITSAGVMPPLASPETIKAVCDWVKAYPARVN